MNMKKHGYGRVLRWLLPLCLAAVLLAAGAVLARYVAEELRSAEMRSSEFHISSDLLKKNDTPTHTVADWARDGVSFSIFNYETENPALISRDATQYTLSFPVGWVAAVADGGGNPVPATDGVYTLPGESAGKVEHRVTLRYTLQTPPAAASWEATVQSVSPYAGVLRATFVTPGDPLPEYEITDHGTYVLVTLRANAYSGAMTVSWDAAFSPDNTNPMMVSWVDGGNRTETVTVTRNTTYQLIFFKNTAAAYEKASTRATQITVGGE